MPFLSYPLPPYPLCLLSLYINVAKKVAKCLSSRLRPFSAVKPMPEDGPDLFFVACAGVRIAGNVGGVSVDYVRTKFVPRNHDLRLMKNRARSLLFSSHGEALRPCCNTTEILIITCGKNKGKQWVMLYRAIQSCQ